MQQIRIGHFLLEEQSEPFIIAEMSGNHNQSLERALALVDAAADAGAHALKLQTYTADTITFDGNHPDFVIKNPGSPWSGETLHNLYQKAHTPWKWHSEIFTYARSKGLIAFSSPFDETAVDFLESLDVPAYKIASFENTHYPLLKKIAMTQKPVIMSTGVATLEEITDSVAYLRGCGCKDLILLKCTSTYPASPGDSHLRTILDMQERFNCPVGISDHTLGIGAAIAAIAYGSKVIEKHLTLRRSEGGVDAAFSLEPEEFTRLVIESKNAHQSLGRVNYTLSEKEQKNRQFKRSIFVVKPLAKGELIEPHHLKVIRPASGLESKYWDQVMGKKASCDIQAGTPFAWELLEE